MAGRPSAGGRVFGGDKAKTRKVAGLHNDVAALEAALGSAKAEYDKVKARNMEVGQSARGLGWMRGALQSSGPAARGERGQGV